MKNENIVFEVVSEYKLKKMKYMINIWNKFKIRHLSTKQKYWSADCTWKLVLSSNVYTIVVVVLSEIS